MRGQKLQYATLSEEVSFVLCVFSFLYRIAWHYIHVVHEHQLHSLITYKVCTTMRNFLDYVCIKTKYQPIRFRQLRKQNNRKKCLYFTWHNIVHENQLRFLITLYLRLILRLRRNQNKISIGKVQSKYEAIYYIFLVNLFSATRHENHFCDIKDAMSVSFMSKWLTSYILTIYKQ